MRFFSGMTPRHRSSKPLPYMNPGPLYNRRDYRKNDGSSANGQNIPYHGAPFAHEEIEFSGQDDAFNALLDYKTRGPMWRENAYIPPADPIRWTDSGPSRLNMRMNTFQWRRMQGNSSSYNQFLYGHTMLPEPYNTAFTQGANKPFIMTQPRQNRVTVARYRGQSYSQTTQVLR